MLSLLSTKKSSESEEGSGGRQMRPELLNKALSANVTHYKSGKCHKLPHETSFLTYKQELSATIASSISVLVTLATVIAVMVAVALVYFAGTQYKRKSRGQLIYDVPYYELPPLPPRIRRMDSGIYDTISNGSKDGLQDQQRAYYAQSESKSLDSKVVSPDSKILAANSYFNNSPLNDESGNTVNDIAISQFPSTNPDTTWLSSTHSVGTDSSSERADLPLNLDTDIAENLNDEFRIPSPNVTENVSYQPSTNFSPERNPAYGTNVAIAPEIETSENIAYEHSESNNMNETVASQSSITSPDAVVSVVPPPTHSIETDSSLERVDRADLLSNLEVREPREDSTAENVNDELRMPSPDVAVNALYQSSTNFNFERNSAYGTNIAIAPEIETSENIAYMDTADLTM